MTPDVRKGAKEVMLSVGLALLRQPTLVGFKKRISAALERQAWLDNASRADVRAAAEGVFRRGLFIKDPSKIPDYCAANADEIVKAFNRSKRREWAKTKKLHVDSRMKMLRAMEDPIVFQLVSSHQKPAEGHKDLQGHLLIDRFWKETLESKGVPPERIREIAKFVKSNDIRTVQWAMGAPCYLIVRPNCRHRLIPVRTDDALSLSLKSLNARLNSGKTYVKRPITDAQRYAQAKALKEEIRSSLNRALTSKYPLKTR